MLTTYYTAVSVILFYLIFLWTGFHVDLPFSCTFLGPFRRETEVVKLLLRLSFFALSIEDSSTNPAIFESTTFFFRIRLPSTRIRRIWIFLNQVSWLENNKSATITCGQEYFWIRREKVADSKSSLRMYDNDGDDDDHRDLFSVLVGVKICPCWICCACFQFQIKIQKN